MLPEQNNTWWAAAFRFAVFQAGLAPPEFWRLSLPELAALAAASGPVAFDTPDRRELESMMLAHPDRHGPERHETRGPLNAAKR